MNGTLIGKVVKHLEDNIINRANATIVCTEERKNQISGTHPPKLYVIHNTPDIDVEQSEFNGSIHKRLRLVYVGIFGTSRFVDKIAEVVAERDDCEFHIGGFGAGMESYFEDMARKHDNIIYYGRIPYDKTIELERNCDVMCAIYDPKIPNHFYAAPNKFYEALSLGKPLLMARNTGMASIVEIEEIGEVIDYNTKSLNEAIDHLISNTRNFLQIAKKEKELYCNKYSWKKMEFVIKDIYSQI